jgi:hypothetical protein
VPDDLHVPYRARRDRSRAASPRSAPHRPHCAGGSAGRCSPEPRSRHSPCPDAPAGRLGRRPYAAPAPRHPAPPLCAAPLLHPDALPRARRARIGAIHPQLPLRPPLRAQRGKLNVLRLHHGPQPRKQRALLPGYTGRIGLIGHKPQDRSTRTSASSTQVSAAQQLTSGGPRPVNGHTGRSGAPSHDLPEMFRQ